MTDLWIGYAAEGSRRDLARALQSVAPFARITFATSARALRDSFADEEPGRVGAIVGLVDEGVSDVNLAAAVVRDGRASDVMLVTRDASGSLRSRANRAGISNVIDLGEVAAASVKHTDTLCAAGERVQVISAGGGSASSKSVAKLPVVVREAEADSDDEAPVLVFASGRGGVGKTTAAALCAAHAASWGMSVAVLDLDLSCGNLHMFFGVRHGADLARLAGEEQTPELMGRANVRLAENVLLWGPCERPEMAETITASIQPLLRYLKSRHDLVIVDTSTTFTDAVAEAIQSADRLLLVHEPGTRSIYSLGRTSALAVRLGVARTRIVRLENKADLREEVAPSFARAEVGLEGARAFRIPEAGEAALDLLSSGEVTELLGCGDDISDAMASMLAQLLSETGALPQNDEAQRALSLRVERRRFTLFGRRKEA